MSNNNQDNLSPRSPSAPAYSKEQLDYMSLCYGAFKINREGKEWLATIKESLIERLAVADPEKDANHAFFREGQNSMVRGIEQNIRLYEDHQKRTNQSGD